MSSSYRSNKLGLSHWVPYAVRKGGCLSCIIVTWWSGSGGIQVWFRWLTGFSRPSNDLCWVGHQAIYQLALFSCITCPSLTLSIFRKVNIVVFGYSFPLNLLCLFHQERYVVFINFQSQISVIVTLTDQWPCQLSDEISSKHNSLGMLNLFASQIRT